jgi:hypothetical protein
VYALSGEWLFSKDTVTVVDPPDATNCEPTVTLDGSSFSHASAAPTPSLFTKQSPLHLAYPAAQLKQGPVGLSPWVTLEDVHPVHAALHDTHTPPLTYWCVPHSVMVSDAGVVP